MRRHPGKTKMLALKAVEAMAFGTRVGVISRDATLIIRIRTLAIERGIDPDLVYQFDKD